MKNLVTNIKILLICAHGISTSFLVKENLKSIIPNCEIELANSQNYLLKKDEFMPDLIFSTVKIDSNIDYLLINPVLDFDSTTSILKEIDNVKMNKILSKENHLYRKSENEIEIEGYKLSELLSKDRIQLEVDATNWKEAIIESAKILVYKNVIESRYIDAMIENVERFGPYIIISDEVALPHASSENGVITTGMSLIKLKKPIKFNGLDNEINFIICLASKNNEHFKAFLSLINGLRKPIYKERLKKAKNKDEIFQVIVDMENRR